MNKEVFTQEFCKAFTIYQQVELIKQYLKELEIPDPSLYLVSKYENEEFKGEVKWATTENNDVSLDVSVYDTNNSTYAGYMHVGDYSTYLDNNYWRIGLDNDKLIIATDVEQGSYIRSGASDCGPYNYMNLGVGENTYISIEDENILLEARGGFYFNFGQLSDISLINAEKIDVKDINYYTQRFKFNELEVPGMCVFPALDLHYPIIFTYYDEDTKGDELIIQYNNNGGPNFDGYIIAGTFNGNPVDGKLALMDEMIFDSVNIGAFGDDNNVTVASPKLGEYTSIQITGIKCNKYYRDYNIGDYNIYI